MPCELKKNKELIGNVATIADLIDYQTDAVVSRTIIDRDVGTITAFAFDKGQGLSEHTAPFDALVMITEGRAKISIADKVHELSEGQMIIMPADVPHALEAIEPYKMMLVMIRSNEK